MGGDGDRAAVSTLRRVRGCASNPNAAIAATSDGRLDFERRGLVGVCSEPPCPGSCAGGDGLSSVELPSLPLTWNTMAVGESPAP